MKNKTKDQSAPRTGTNLLSGLAKAVLLESRRSLEQADQAFRLWRGRHLREPLGFVLERRLSVHGHRQVFRFFSAHASETNTEVIH